MSTSKSLESLNIKKLKIPESARGNGSPEKFLNMTERGVQNTSSIINDLIRILSVESTQKIVPIVNHLKESHKNHKKYRKFFKKLSLLVVECSPSGYFQKEPNIQQVWKWITLFLEEYMKIRQSV